MLYCCERLKKERESTGLAVKKPNEKGEADFYFIKQHLTMGLRLKSPQNSSTFSL